MTDIYFLIVLEAGSLKRPVQSGSGWDLVCSYGPSSVCTWRQRNLSSSSSKNREFCWMRAPIFLTSFNLNDVQIGPCLQIQPHWKIRTSASELGWGTWVRSLGREEPLKEGTATHASVLAWRIPWMEEPGGLQSMGSPRGGHD